MRTRRPRRRGYSSKAFVEELLESSRHLQLRVDARKKACQELAMRFMPRNGIKKPCKAEDMHRVHAEVGDLTQSQDERSYAVRQQQHRPSVCSQSTQSRVWPAEQFSEQLLSRVNETRQVCSRHSAQHSHTVTFSSSYSTVIFWLDHSFWFCPFFFCNPPLCNSTHTQVKQPSQLYPPSQGTCPAFAPHQTPASQFYFPLNRTARSPSCHP